MKVRWLTGGIGKWEFALRLYRGILQDDILGRSAQLSYYFLLALVPALIFVTSIFGMVLGSQTHWHRQFFGYLQDLMPATAYELVHQSVSDVAKNSTSEKLSFGLLVALWAASAGMCAIAASLNIAYRVVESRPWWKLRLIALCLTIAQAVLILCALTVVLYGGKLVDAIAGAQGFGPAFLWTWKILQWPIAIAFLLLAFESIYYFMPDLRHPKWVWITPGSIIAATIWLLLSIGFRIYLEYFNTYDKAYGSLGAVIVLMLWLYLTGAAVLVGGKVNAEIELGPTVARASSP